MKCDICDKTATVFLTQIVEGKMKKVNLCADCSKQNGVTDPTGFALADMLSGNTVTTPEPVEDRGSVCKSCGFSRNDFKRTGRFGCADCYQVFREELENLLQNMHKGTRHKGKIPKRAILLQKEQQIDEMKQELALAVIEERFEDAARLRDQIRNAETTIRTF